jgi:drug/metabolite transporter (DMT)-like permease
VKWSCLEVVRKLLSKTGVASEEGTRANEKKKIAKFILVGYLTAFGAAILNALIPSLSKPLLVSVNPLLFTGLVTLTPAFLFTPVSIKSRENKRFKTRGYLILAISAVAANLVAPYMYFIGLRETTASNAVLLANAEMIFTVLIATRFFGERLSKKGVFALSILAVGIICVVTDLQFSISFESFIQPGNVLIILATLLWGVDNNVTSAITQKFDVARVIQLKALISGLGLISIAFFLHAIVFNGAWQLVEILLFGLLVFSGAVYLSIETLRRLGAVTTTIVFPINSAFGLFFAFALLGESITLLQVMSLILIFFGIYLLTRKGSVVRMGINLEQI